MPTYNGAKFLPAALQGIRAQADPQIEIIAVDDGSTDETLAILRDFSRQCPLRIIERNHFGNWVANTNHGLRAACGEFACFLHQDDAWLPGRLDRLRAAVRENPTIRFWLHPCRFIDPTGRTLGKWTCPLGHHSNGVAAHTVLERLLVQNWIGVPAPLFRREDALAVGMLDESLWYTADWDFWLKLAALGRTRYLPQALASFRIHPTSQTITRGKEPGAIAKQCKQVLARHFATWRSAARRKLLVSKVASLTIEVNGYLADRLAGSRVSWYPLLKQFCMLGPQGWWRFVRDSRLIERVLARLRARVKRA
jgi:GT2 family glycosyltransferase